MDGVFFSEMSKKLRNIIEKMLKNLDLTFYLSYNVGVIEKIFSGRRIYFEDQL